MVSPFRQHGSFTTELRDRQITSNVVGPWNIELVNAWASQMVPYFKVATAERPLLAMAIYSGSILASPATLERMRGIVEYSVRVHHMHAYAVVAGADVEGRLFMQHFFSPLFEGFCPYAFFLEREPAQCWLNAHL